MDNQELVLKKGNAAPIGATVTKEGVNFSLFSKNATHVSLLLFNQVEDMVPFREIALDRYHNRTYHYWHIQIEGLKVGQLYAYKVNGPNDKNAGHRFDSEKLLIDPYSRAFALPKSYNI